MKQLDLDFAERGLVFWLYRANLHLWVALLVLCLVLVASIWQWRAVGHDALRLDQALAQLEKKQARLAPAVAVAPKLSAEQFKAAQAVIRQLNQPWLSLLETLEATRKGRVALLEVRLDGANDRIRGVAEAKNPQEMLRFLSQMKAQPLLTSVELNVHQISQTDANKPYRFEFSAYWQSEGGLP